MKRLLPLVVIILASAVVFAAADQAEIGVKANTNLDLATFTNFYMNANFSLGASLAAEVQTPSSSLSVKHVQLTGKYHAPSVRNNLSLFGGGGLRMGLNDSSNGDNSDNPVSSVLVFGMRVNSNYGLSLLGEFNLVSPIADLSDYKLEPWFGLGFRF